MTDKTIVNKHLHIFYSGPVQGIGFRYTAQRIADSLKLAGWVKNLSDGRVEVIVEGARPDIELFLQRIDDIFKKYIRDIVTEWGEAAGDFTGFDIRF